MSAPVDRLIANIFLHVIYSFVQPSHETDEQRDFSQMIPISSKTTIKFYGNITLTHTIHYFRIRIHRSPVRTATI